MLYCDTPQFSANCHDGPIEAGCRTAPCYLVPEVGRCLTGNCAGFAYGRYADLSITPNKVGSDVVWVSAEVAGVTTSFAVNGQCLP
jgi:hypothetical protein